MLILFGPEYRLRGIKAQNGVQIIVSKLPFQKRKWRDYDARCESEERMKVGNLVDYNKGKVCASIIRGREGIGARIWMWLTADP